MKDSDEAFPNPLARKGDLLTNELLQDYNCFDNPYWWPNFNRFQYLDDLEKMKNEH